MIVGPRGQKLYKLGTPCPEYPGLRPEYPGRVLQSFPLKEISSRDLGWKCQFKNNVEKSCTVVSLEQFRTFWLNKLLCFPGSFSFGVIAPLDFVEMADLIASDPSLVIHNFDRMLWINKIGLQLQFLYVNKLFWNTEAFPELRDMENIMNRG